MAAASDSIIEVIDLVSEADPESSQDCDLENGNYFMIDTTPDYSYLTQEKKRKRAASGQEMIAAPATKQSKKNGGRVKPQTKRQKKKKKARVVDVPETINLLSDDDENANENANANANTNTNTNTNTVTNANVKVNVNVNENVNVPLRPQQDQSQENSLLRPVVIDGCNVAFGHGRKTRFSSVGLKKCIEWFEKRGHQVLAFVPLFRRRHPLTLDYQILDELEDKGVLVFTPSRHINGKRVVPYDDRYIVEYASTVGGVIVSRDNYQDLLKENPQWTETINNRLLMYTWAKDTIMFPQDPLGRGGPTLSQFLQFPPHKKK